MRALGDAGVTQVVLIGRDPTDSIAGVPCFADAIEGAGALGALYTAVLTGAGTVVLVLAGDMPFVTPSLMSALIALDAADAKVPYAQGRRHPLCAAYRRRVAASFKARLDRGALRVTDAIGEIDVREITEPELAELDPTGKLLMNVNTPDDYREAERHARTLA